MTSTSVSITFLDETNKVTFSIDVTILMNGCDFFKGLLVNFKEKDQESITIKVSNAYVAYDVVMDFSGVIKKGNSGNLESWRHRLELIKCYDYWCMPYDSSLLKDLKVPPEEGFDLLLDVIELVGYNDITIKLISDNLPKNYDVYKFPKELIDEMIRLNKLYRIISSGHERITIWDALTGKLIKTIDKNDIEKDTFSISEIDAKSLGIINTSDKKHVKYLINTMLRKYAIFNPNKQQFEYGKIDVLTGAHIIINNRKQICFSPNGENVAYVKKRLSMFIYAPPINEKVIVIADATSWKSICETLDCKIDILCVNYSLDNRTIASGDYYGVTTIWDAYTGKKIKSLVKVKKHFEAIECVCYTPDNLQIITADSSHNINIWDILTGKLIKTFNVISTKAVGISNICCHPCSQFVIVSDSTETIRIWDILTGELVQTLQLPNAQNYYTYVSATVVDDDDLIQRLTMNQ